MIDFIGACIGIVLLSPLFLVIALLIKWEDLQGPVFFKQKRIGKNGEFFYIYKFRSMITDAENTLKANRDLYEKYIQNNYKLEPHEDPRITRIGRFLRATSLDEFPQLINVFMGNMSLVGPRPVVTEELREYKDRIDEFLSVKPGVTGYWQVSGRSNVGYPERVGIELYYVYHQSLKLDISILCKTVLMVILRRGAY
ncbi:sugar transferase [Ectobacillus sp. sgz5001026]|uniref:sugar transferase n=1 Tax=Ectobacillus sp. sgz5001026 TaxID=3242473 RepID=UPI0036D30433